MKLEDAKPMHCHALASRLLAETRKIREEMGRQEDSRAIPEITGAEPREVYFEALVTWRKASRLASELGVETARPLTPTPALGNLLPGHVLDVLENVLALFGDIKDASRHQRAITVAPARDRSSAQRCARRPDPRQPRPVTRSRAPVHTV